MYAPHLKAGGGESLSQYVRNACRVRDLAGRSEPPSAGAINYFPARLTGRRIPLDPFFPGDGRADGEPDS